MYTFNLFIKRCFDVVSSSILALLISPLLIVVALAIKWDSPGPIFFRQQRWTKGGRSFTMLKFRSMVVNAEQMGSSLYSFEDDPRVTRLGHFLRDTSIDELPQLFNIIMGDMSVVGPRPCVAYELGDFETLNKRYKKRFDMKAGLTGLAQINGRNSISWDVKVGYDNQYVDNFKRIGIIEDIKILFWTVIKVFKREDIHEQKKDESMTDDEAAKFEEEELIRIAHLPDE